MNKVHAKYWLPLTLLAAIALGFLFLLVLPNPKQTADEGDVQIGGPFELVDSGGTPRKASDFHGQYLLIFFGYTFCPDVCPVTLQTISDAIERLGAKGTKVTPVFITLDPARDTPETMGRYLANFHPRFVGLTGTPAQIATAAKAYHVYYAKSDEDEDEDKDANYLVDHSAILFFMGPDGKFQTHFRHVDSAEKISEEISRRIR